MSKRIKLGVLVSGRGSNMQAIDQKCRSGELLAEVVCVISNVEDAPALEYAREKGIPAIFLNRRDYPSRAAYNTALADKLEEFGVDLVVLAGFMMIVTKELLDRFPNAVMNIHPALLPSFPGLHAQLQALEHGVKISGCTVHFVDEGTDTGPIIIQAAVPILENDTEDSLSTRILKEEHRIYPEAIGFFAQGLLRVMGRKVEISCQ